jgi:Ran GTPase-activating protein (RanGAP) involved in mRNA processing and transport
VDTDDGAYIGVKELKAICRSPHLTNLSHLCLRQTDFGDAGAKELVESGLLKRLKVLDLYGGCISDEGAKVLAGCPDFKNLEFANLRKNALTAAGIKLLKATKVNLDVREQHTFTTLDFAAGYEHLPGYLFEGDFE